MGNVIAFPQPKTVARSDEDERAGLSAKLSDWTSNLNLAESRLKQAEQSGMKALRLFAKYEVDLQWTTTFCDRCQAAYELSDVAAMIEARDELISEYSSKPRPLVRARFP
jgi:hypothetical protein